MVRYITLVLAVIAVALFVNINASGAHVEGPGAGAIHTCVNNSSGEVKVVDEGDSCKKNQTPLDFANAIKTIARAHGLGPNETGDNGVLPSRVLSFNKMEDDTGVRVTWTDNRRCFAANRNAACSWEIIFDEASCPNPGPLRFDYHELKGQNDHTAATVVGTCFGLDAGPHTIEIRVGAVPGVNQLDDAFTGWRSGYWTLEAEEVR